MASYPPAEAIGGSASTAESLGTIPLELAVFSLEDALTARSHGASRIELNANGSYAAGGLTPDMETVRTLVSYPRVHISRPIRIMIRPRVVDGAADFVYSSEDYRLMADAITAFRDSGLLNPVRGDGFVFGILEADRSSDSNKVSVDFDRCKALVERAHPYPCVFHRAFDPIAASDDWRRGLDTLVECGFAGLLTAGGTGNYLDNLARLDEICEYAARRLQIVVGGGVRAAHVRQAVAALQLEGSISSLQSAEHQGRRNVWMHSSCLIQDADLASAKLLDRREFSNLLHELSSGAVGHQPFSIPM